MAGTCDGLTAIQVCLQKIIMNGTLCCNINARKHILRGMPSICSLHVVPVGVLICLHSPETPELQGESYVSLVYVCYQ